VSAQLALGALRAERARTDEDWADVAQWYRSAAQAGHPSAMRALGELCERGRGEPQDRSAALALYRRALQAGARDAEHDVRRLETELASTSP